MKTPGNPVLAKAMAEGKTEDQAIKEAKDEAAKVNSFRFGMKILIDMRMRKLQSMRVQIRRKRQR